MNRAERRRAARNEGFRGSKAKHGRGLVEATEMAIMRARQADEQASLKKVVSAATNIREKTHGRFWLPGESTGLLDGGG